MAKTGLNITVIIIAVLILAAIAGFFIYDAVRGKATVAAIGNYETKVQPDEAVVYLQVQTKSSSAEQAKDDNAKIVDNVMTALIKVGLERSDIETENFNINPDYNWTSGRNEIIGYTASHNIKITTKDFANVGKIIDAAVDNGALVSYINFELSNAKSNEYKAQALASASQDARTKASSIASGLGKTLGQIVSITTSDYNYYPYPLYRAEASGGADVKSVATNIQPKSLDITATVTVTFEIV